MLVVVKFTPGTVRLKFEKNDQGLGYNSIGDGGDKDGADGDIVQQFAVWSFVVDNHGEGDSSSQSSGDDDDLPSPVDGVLPELVDYPRKGEGHHDPGYKNGGQNNQGKFPN